MRTYSVDEVIQSLVSKDKIGQVSPVFLHNTQGRGMIHGAVWEQINIAQYNEGRQKKVVRYNSSYDPLKFFKEGVDLYNDDVFIAGSKMGGVTKGFSQTAQGIEKTFYRESKDTYKQLKDIVWFDTETTGAMYTDDWSITDAYFRKVRVDGSTEARQYFFKQSNKKTSQINDLIANARKSLTETGIDGLTKDQRRDIARYASYQLDDQGRLVSQQVGLDINASFNLKNLDAAEEGLKHLNKHGVSLSKTLGHGQAFGNQLNDFVGDATIAGHNIIDFDLPMLNKATQGRFKTGNIIDTLPFLRSVLPDQGPVAANLDDAARHFEGLARLNGRKRPKIAVADAYRHTGAGDVEMNIKVFQEALHNQDAASIYYAKAAALKNAAPSAQDEAIRIGTTTKTIYRTDARDVVYRNFNGKPEVIDGDSLTASRLFKNGVQYEISGVRYTDAGVMAKLIESDTGDTVFITRNTPEDLNNFFEDVFGGQVQAKSIQNASMKSTKAVDKNLTYLFKGDNAYYNLNQQLNILDRLKSQGITDIQDNRNIPAIQKALDGMSDVATAQKTRFLQNRKTLASQEKGLRNIVKTVDDLIPTSPSIGGAAKRADTHKKNLLLSSIYEEFAITKKEKLSGQIVKGLDLGDNIVLKKGQDNASMIGRYIKNQMSHTANPSISDYRMAYNNLLNRLVDEGLIDANEASNALGMISKELQGNLTAQAGGNAKGTGVFNTYLSQMIRKDNNGKPRGWKPLNIRTMNGVDFTGKQQAIEANIKAAAERIKRVNNPGDLVSGLSKSITVDGKKALLKARGFQGVDDYTMKAGIDDHLKSMAEAFQKQHIGMFVTESTTEGQIEAILYRFNDYDKVFKLNGTQLQVLPNNPAAKVIIPVGKNGNIQYKNMSKKDTIRVGAFVKDGQLNFDLDLSSHHAVGKLNTRGTIAKAAKLINEGNAGQASAYLDRTIYNIISHLGQNESMAFGSMVDDALSYTKTGGSPGQQWVRGGVIDIGSAVETIFKEANKELNGGALPTYSRSYTQAMQFVQLASQGKFDYQTLDKHFPDKGDFSAKVKQNLYNLAQKLRNNNINLVGIKAEAVQGGKFSIKDPRMLTVLGNLTSGSKENMLTVFNHLSLNAETAAENMKAAGKSIERIKDLFSRDLITQQYIEAYQVPKQGKHVIRSGINANVIYIDDAALKKHWYQWAADTGRDVSSMSVPTVYLDQMTVSEDILPALNTHRKRGIWLDDDFEFTKKASDLLKKGESYTVTNDSGMLLGLSGQKEIRLQKGDILEGLERDADGRVRVIFNEADTRRMGKKVLTDGGQRSTIVPVSDDFLQYVAAKEGLQGTFSGFVGINELKSTNVADIYGSRLKYILNQSSREQIEAALQKSPALKNMISWSDDYGRFVIKGDFDILSQGEDHIKGVFGEIDQLGKNLGVQVKGTGQVLGGRVEIRAADVAHYETPVGFGSDDFLARNSKLKYGSKEMLAIRDTVTGAKLAYQAGSLGEGQLLSSTDFDSLIVALEKGMKPSEKLSQDGQTILKSLSLTSEINRGDVVYDDFIKARNFLEVGIGGETHEFNNSRVALSEIFGEVTPVKGAYDPLDYPATTYARLRQMTDQNFAVIALPEEVSLLTKDGAHANRKVKSLVVPLIDPERVNGKFMPTSVERNVNNIFEAMYQVQNAAPGQEHDEAIQNLGRTVQKYTADTGSIMYKESELFKTMTSKRLSNATASVTLANNISMYYDDAALKGSKGIASVAHHSMEQSIVINKDVARKMLSIDDSLFNKDGILSDKGKQAFQSLKWMYEEQLGSAYQPGESMNVHQQVDDIITQILDSANIDKHGTKARGMIGQTNRFPSTNLHAVQFANIFVSDQIEAGSSKMSIGLAQMLRADYDGDHIYQVFALLNAELGGRDDYMNAAKAARTTIEYNKAIAQGVAGDLHENYMSTIKALNLEDNAEMKNKIAKVLANQQAQAFDQSSSRFGKAVGGISNVSTAARNTLELVQMVGTGSSGSTRAQGQVLTGFFETLEQNMISAKKAGEAIQKNLVEEKFGEMSTWSDDVWNLVTSTKQELTEAVKDFSKFEDDTVFALMEKIGLATKSDDGTQYIIRSQQVQEALKRIGIEGTNPNLVGADGVTSDFIKQSMREMNARIQDSQTGHTYNSWMKSLAARFGQTQYTDDAAGEVLNTIDRLYDPTDTIYLNANATRILSGEHSLIDQSNMMRDQFTQRVRDGAAKRAAANFDDIGTSAMSQKIASGGGTMAAIGKVAAPVAIGVAALWAASAVLRPPRIDQTPQTGEQEFDPSLAERLSVGAPGGSGPTARLVPKSLYPSYNININANSFNDLTNEQIAGIIEGEVYRQTNMNVNLNLDSRDSKESLNRSWFERKISSFL